MKETSRSGYLELALCGVVWGSIGVIARKVSVGAAAIAFFRLAIGSLAVVAFFALRGRMRELRLQGQRWLLVLDGAILGVHWLFMFAAFKKLSVATAILIVFLGPVFVAAGVGRLLNEPVERKTIFSLVLSVTGSVLIAVPAWRVKDSAGLGYALASAVAFAALVIANKRLTRTYKPPAILSWQLGIAALCVAPFLVTEKFSRIPGSMGWLVTLAIVHTVLTGLVYFRGLTVVKAQHAGILAYLEPVTAVFYAWIFLHEHPAVLTLFGGALVLAAGLNIVAPRPLPALSEPAGSEPLAPAPGSGHH